MKYPDPTRRILTLLLISCSMPMSWADWLADVSTLQNEQPHWMTPLVTVTPRLEQEYRLDILQIDQKNGGHVDNYGNGKGLELITPFAPVEVALSGPAYIHHPDSTAVNGWSDSSFLLKYRLLAANENNGNYIATIFMGGSLPTGSDHIGNGSAIYTPTLALGKGSGQMDIQSTLSYSLPVSNTQHLGHQLVWNTALQIHVNAFWPEIEYNQISYRDGPNSGERQGQVTLGTLWRHRIVNRLGLALGIGYEHPVTTFNTQKNTWIGTARLSF